MTQSYLLNVEGTGVKHEIVPVQAEIEPYYYPAEEVPAPTTYRERIYEYCVDGRLIIHSLCVAVFLLSGVTLWLFITWLFHLIMISLVYAPLVLTAAGAAGIIVIKQHRAAKQGSVLYLKGCPTRSPGVHKVTLCDKH